jgi:hypothetical protein
VNSRADTAVETAFDDHVQRDPAIAERNLMRAILRTAFEDIKKRGESYRLARQFFLSNDEFYLFSFKSICYHLNLCPHTIRNRLRLIRDSELERMAA